MSVIKQGSAHFLTTFLGWKKNSVLFAAQDCIKKWKYYPLLLQSWWIVQKCCHGKASENLRCFE